MKEKLVVDHPLLGEYKQIVYDTAEGAGHRSLASEGKYGWEMPSDPATQQLIVDRSLDEVIVDLGCGLGNAVAFPCLQAGARMVYAWDVSKEHVGEKQGLG